MKSSTLRVAALSLALTTSACLPPEREEATITIAPPEAEGQDPEVQLFVNCTSERINDKIAARKRGESVPPTTQKEVLNCAGPAFGLTDGTN